MGRKVNVNNILINNIAVKGNRVECEIKVSKVLERYFNTNSMYIEYDFNIESIPKSILTIPFVGSLIALAWLTDSVFWVDEIDKTFYDSIPTIRNAYQDIYRNASLKGRFAPSKIINNRLERDPRLEAKSIMLFSGGADCHASLIRNLDKHPMLCNIQGWYKDSKDNDVAAEADFRDIKLFASQMNLMCSFVKSNFAVVVNEKHFNKTMKYVGDTWWHGFQHSMAFISIAIPIAYSIGVDEIIIASSLTKGLNFLCASNVTTDSEFNFACDGHTLHDGFELNRQDKMHVIVDFQKKLGRAYPIRVCSFNDHNCCECEKCLRTILGIVAEGGDIKDFGFYYEESSVEHWQKVIYDKGGLMSFNSEQYIHWPHTRKRMDENYENIIDKEFVDWFLNFDFDKAKKEGLRRYYRQNFFSILKRKLHL